MGDSLHPVRLIVHAAFSAQAATIYVPDEYPKIQWAINNASAGDVIIVGDGVYLEHININKPLSLISENGSENTILDSNNSGSAVLVSASDVTIDGFSIRNFGTGPFDSGVKISNQANNVSVRDCDITKGRFGIFSIPWYSELANDITIENCTISHTSVAISGSMLNSTIKNNWIFNNSRGISGIFMNVDIIDTKMNNNRMGICLVKSSFSKMQIQQ